MEVLLLTRNKLDKWSQSGYWVTRLRIQTAGTERENQTNLQGKQNQRLEEAGMWKPLQEEPGGEIQLHKLSMWFKISFQMVVRIRNNNEHFFFFFKSEKGKKLEFWKGHIFKFYEKFRWILMWMWKFFQKLYI